MELTVLLAVGVCIATISEVTVTSLPIHSVRACKPKHKKHSKNQEPSLAPGHSRLPAEPTCEGVECTDDQVCHLVQVQCLVAPCPPVASCVPLNESGKWTDSEVDWIDDPNGERKSVEVERNHSKDGAGGTIPSYQAPIYIEASWKGDKTIATRHETTVNKLEPAKNPNPRKPTFQNVYNPDSHKDPIPNSGEVPVGTQIPHGPNSSTATDVNLGSEVPEDLVHHGGNTGPSIPVGSSNYHHGDERGIHRSPDTPDDGVNPGGPLIPVGPTGPSEPNDSIPDPGSRLLDKGKKHDKLANEASQIHPVEIHGAGSSVRERHPKIRACRTRKSKHRHDRTPT